MAPPACKSAYLRFQGLRESVAKIGKILRVGHIKINAGIWINERTVIIKAKEPVAWFYIDWVTVAFYN